MYIVALVISSAMFLIVGLLSKSILLGIIADGLTFIVVACALGGAPTDSERRQA